MRAQSGLSIPDQIETIQRNDINIAPSPLENKKDVIILHNDADL